MAKAAGKTTRKKKAEPSPGRRLVRLFVRAALGIVAEYLARVHANVQGRPLYIVAEERTASRAAAAAGALEAAG